MYIPKMFYSNCCSCLLILQAHIRVAPPKDGKNTPYVRGYAMCGKHGEYMHLTPNYVLNDFTEYYGPKGISFKQYNKHAHFEF